MYCLPFRREWKSVRGLLGYGMACCICGKVDVVEPQAFT